MARYTAITALVVLAALAMTAQATPYWRNGGTMCKVRTAPRSCC
jgi:hypothetical protein